jgi:hypothetical protein
MLTPQQFIFSMKRSTNRIDNHGCVIKEVQDRGKTLGNKDNH